MALFLHCFFIAPVMARERGLGLSFSCFCALLNSALPVQYFRVRVCNHAFSGLGVMLCEAMMFLFLDARGDVLKS